ncbi:MAG: polysaccharide deacetylase family protein [Pseudomonadota bacterium]
MSLPDDYTTYAKRRYGQDIDRYSWRPTSGREKAALPGGAQVGASIVVPLEWFPLTPSGEPFRHPGAMATPYPDLRHYTVRDYGNRVGAFRLLRAFAEADVKATFAVNAALIGRASPLIDAVRDAGHEIAAHGLSTDHIHWGGLPEPDEKRFVDETRSAFEAAGLSPRAWMSPARQQSRRTPDLIRSAGFDVCLDWEPDLAPLAMTTDAGPLAAFPLLNELDDRTLLTVKHHDEEAWRAQIVEAAAYMHADAARRGAQCFGFTMTPYVVGQPFRLRAVRDLLDALCAMEGVLLAPASDIVNAFAATEGGA